MDDDEMPIGRFAQLSGLSIHTLRHYDDVGLLLPARVDPDNGYRSYRRSQLALARTIRSLRHIDLPLEEVRFVLNNPERGVDVLGRHRTRIERAVDLQSARLTSIDRLIKKGIIVSEPNPTALPVQIKLQVDDLVAARAFYEQAFGFRAENTRRESDQDAPGFVFGSYGSDGFFLIHLHTAESFDAFGPSTIGLLVPDLDAAQARAVNAGAASLVSPVEKAGMPRSSAVRDPSGNVIWLYQS